MSEILSIKDLSLTLNKKLIFSNLSFNIENGSFCAICGKNGAGKSQLLRVLKGLEKPTSGQIIVNNEDLTKDRKKRNKNFGLVFQNADIQLIGESVEKDISFGLENIGCNNIAEKVNETISLLGLEKQRKQRPNTLSGGEKRKVAIAGVIALDVQILLLDEPFANLDYPSTIKLLKTLLKLKSLGFTILVVTHEIEKFLAHLDKIIILKDGLLISDEDAKKSLDKLREAEIYVPKLKFEDITWL